MVASKLGLTISAALSAHTVRTLRGRLVIKVAYPGPIERPDTWLLLTDITYGPGAHRWPSPALRSDVSRAQSYEMQVPQVSSRLNDSDGSCVAVACRSHGCMVVAECIQTDHVWQLPAEHQETRQGTQLGYDEDQAVHRCATNRFEWCRQRCRSERMAASRQPVRWMLP